MTEYQSSFFLGPQPFGPPTAGCVVVDFKDREVCYVKFWWLLFLALKFTFLYLYLAKIQIFIPKSAYGGGVHRFKKYS